jgi:hypothetical protein
VGVIVVRRYIVGIEMIACHGVMSISKKRSITKSCVQKIQNLINERKLNDMSCWGLIDLKNISVFFILGVPILLIFIFLAIVGIENTKIVAAMQTIDANVKY